MEFVLAFILVAAVVSPLFFAYHQKVTGKESSRIKRTLIFNLSAFALMMIVGLIAPLGGFVSAASATASTVSTGAGLGYLAAAIGTGISGIGGGFAVATGSSAAIGAITEDPKVFGKSLLFVGLGEGVALYGFVIGIMIVNAI
jgi:V/A-type H+/Na+-transporting ATPase subunit K